MSAPTGSQQGSSPSGWRSRAAQRARGLRTSGSSSGAVGVGISILLVAVITWVFFWHYLPFIWDHSFGIWSLIAVFVVFVAVVVFTVCLVMIIRALRAAGRKAVIGAVVSLFVLTLIFILAANNWLGSNPNFASAPAAPPAAAPAAAPPAAAPAAAAPAPAATPVLAPLPTAIPVGDIDQIVPDPNVAVPSQQIVDKLRVAKPNGNDYRAPYTTDERTDVFNSLDAWIASHVDSPAVKDVAAQLGTTPAQLQQYMRDRTEVSFMGADSRALASDTYSLTGDVVSKDYQLKKDTLVLVDKDSRKALLLVADWQDAQKYEPPARTEKKSDKDSTKSTSKKGSAKHPHSVNVKVDVPDGGKISVTCKTMDGSKTCKILSGDKVVKTVKLAKNGHVHLKVT